MTEPHDWLAIVTSLPTRNAAQRMRVLRTLESMGCAVLRDGVFLLPDTAEHRQALKYQVEYVTQRGGTVTVLNVRAADAAQEREFRGMFDRTREYEELAKAVRGLSAGFGISDPAAIARVLNKQRREFEAIQAVDFFPGPSRKMAEEALTDAENAVNALLFPSEEGRGESLRRLDPKDYQGRVWATRDNPWADRLGSAWLIRHFIDSQARFKWLDKNEFCPSNAVSFGFDGASFANVGTRVTFEVLLASFGLDSNRALQRVGQLVHYLEVGGTPVPEANGVETLLLGALRRCDTDMAALLEQSDTTFNLLYDAYATEPEA